MALKNKYFAIVYKGVLEGLPVKKIHKRLYDETINNKVVDKYLLGFFIKTTNKAKKVSVRDGESLALALFLMFKDNKLNDKAKKIINHELSKEAERKKLEILDDFIDKSRKDGKWFYLASSHNDCAKDHKDWQGKLYVDKNAPDEVIEYAKSRNLYTLQWVIDSPVRFITRPNCRHYFVSLKYSEVMKKSLKKLKRKYKTHSLEGDRALATPAHEAIAEYEDRLKMLRALYREHPTPEIKKEIEKTELLLKKWKKTI